MEQWPSQRPAPPARPTLPSDPQAHLDADTREGLCRGLLRHPNSPGRQRNLVESFISHLAAWLPGTTAVPDLQTQLATPNLRRCSHETPYPGLHSCAKRWIVASKASSWSVSMRASYRWHPQKPFLILRFVVLAPESFADIFLLRAALLQPASALEAQLVPARFRLRPRTARAGSKSMRKPRSACEESSEPPRHIQRPLLSNLEAFAPAGEWEELSCTAIQGRNDDDLSATHRSASTCAARGAIATAISMVGRRRKPVPPWSSAAALRRPSAPISSGRIQCGAVQRVGCVPRRCV